MLFRVLVLARHLGFSGSAVGQPSLAWSDSAYVAGQEKEIRVAFDGRFGLHPTDPAAALMDSIAGMMRRHPGMIIAFDVHTDARDRADRNLKLSELRAQALKNRLVERGIAPERIMAFGHGEEQPIIPEDPIRCLVDTKDREAAHGVNRRNILRIVSTGP